MTNYDEAPWPDLPDLEAEMARYRAQLYAGPGPIERWVERWTITICIGVILGIMSGLGLIIARGL